MLLTGATGFLGASLLRASHRLRRARRLPGEIPGQAIQLNGCRANLRRFGVWREGDGADITSVDGRHRKAMARPGARALPSARVRGERRVSRRGGRQLGVVIRRPSIGERHRDDIACLRFACAGLRKHFHFVSSLSVCFAHEGPREVSEDTDMLGQVDRLPLGYAQSKCVAESLVRAGRHAGRRCPDLPAGAAGRPLRFRRIERRRPDGGAPQGLYPDGRRARSGLGIRRSARGHRGGRCDRPAESSHPRRPLETFHLRHPRPRHWRECVLWANFFGYPMRLEPYSMWVERLMRDFATPDHALYRLRSFFTRRFHGRTIPEQLRGTHAQSCRLCTDAGPRAWRRHDLSASQCRASRPLFPGLCRSEVSSTTGPA